MYNTEATVKSGYINVLCGNYLQPWLDHDTQKLFFFILFFLAVCMCEALRTMLWIGAILTLIDSSSSSFAIAILIDYDYDYDSLEREIKS